VFVTQAPELLYLEDTDGDGVADRRRVVLTGFSASRTAQIRFSHPTLGPDGWLYLTSGLNGGRVTSPAHPHRPPVEFTSSDSRFNPRTGDFELVGGQGQYGLSFDAYGRRFICANRHPVWHVVLEPWHLRRNPHLAFSDTVQEVSAVGAEAKVWPLSQDLTTASFMPSLMQAPHRGTFTSASGVHIHRGDALPEGHEHSVFITESAQNLVQRQVLTRVGVSFRSRPAREGAEFLASRDTWFRPVFATGGPDGALYIVDMYRKDIDHPAYIPPASRSLFDFTAGKERGRIYRLAAAERRPAASAASLEGAPVQTLVGSLAHANGWWRDAAERRLIEQNARAASAALRSLATGGNELARLHALWTLSALATLEHDDIVRAMKDPSPGVREQAVQLASSRTVGSRALLDGVLAAAADDDSRVRLQAALALGETDDARRIGALAAIARRDGSDRWVRAAVLSSLRDDASAFLSAFVDDATMTAPSHAAVMQDLARLFGVAESLDRCRALLNELADPRLELSWQPAALSGLAEGLRTRRGATDATRSTLLALVSGDTPQARTGRERLGIQLARAAVLVSIDEAPAEQRLAAIELLGHGDWQSSGAALLRLLDPRQPGAVQIAAVRALGQLRDPEAAPSLVVPARWNAYSPRVRAAVVTTLVSDERHVAVLLDAIEKGQLPASTLGAATWRQLTTHRVPAIRERAAALSSAAGSGMALQAYERIRGPVLAQTGDPARGAAAFAAFCVTCHTFDGTGGKVGPDLSGIRNQPPDALLLHIVVPDYEITPGYETYTVQTRDGRTVAGRLESEAPNALTLRDAAGSVQTVRRQDIESMGTSSSSLMPAGLDKALSPAQLADVIAYLKRPQP
jgi:putative membrane-bound dehydrogenase-like protein